MTNRTGFLAWAPLLLLSSAAAAAPPAPVTALAYRPDGKQLAAAVHREVMLVNVADGAVAARLGGLPGRATALAFSRDGARLAVGCGGTGQPNEVRIYTTAQAAPERVLAAAHADVIHDLAFSPDGKRLATAGYDRLVKLWDLANPAAPPVLLKDHSDAVYSVAFSPDGKLLASAAADRAVKVWDTVTGKRLYTLGDPTDWVYAVAFSPDGKHLAAAGADKSIRIWEVSPEGGRLVHSAFAHDGPVLRLVYAADGKTLDSLGQDRVVKSWQAGPLAERSVYPKQPDAVLSLALRPDGKQLALGRYDGALLLLDAASGKVQSQPLPEAATVAKKPADGPPAKPQPPVIKSVSPNSAVRGQTMKVNFTGERLDGVTAVTADRPGVTARLLPEGRTPTKLTAEVTFPADAAAGSVPLRLKNAAGDSALQTILLDRFPAVVERESNDSPGTGMAVKLPTAIAGTISRAGEVDFFRFEAKAGQEVGVQVLAGSIGSKLDPVVQLTGPDGAVLAEGATALGAVCPTAGVYALGVRDREYRGGPAMTYRLQVGPVPVVTSVFPLGLTRGTEQTVTVRGVNLGGAATAKVKAPADAAPGARLPVPVTTPHGPPLGSPAVVVGEFPGIPYGSPGKDAAPPFTGEGELSRPGEVQKWPFVAKKGQKLIIEVEARRLGSPLDPAIEVLDAAGRPVPRAVLRCLAQTFVTFRDHDSALTGIRMEAWNEFAIDDYVYLGGELIRIKELPKNPDDDCQFYAEGKQRLAFLDTTPVHHSQGTPMYKVAIHPPGTTFPPNGMPAVTLYYRNDDGGPGYGKDAKLTFEAPADGQYWVRVRDARGAGGPGHAYRVTVRPPRPDFRVRFSPTAPNVAKGQAAAIAVTATRLDGFDGPIQVRLENLPPGFQAPPSFVEGGQMTTTFALTADANATKPGDKLPPLKLVVTATIDGHEVRHETTGALPKLIDPGDLITTTAASEVTLRPGQESRLLVRIERRNGFKGRVPLEVRGLPHGVRVLNIGLNGILVTERDSTREVVLYAEPWVKPAEHPFVVLATREGKGTEHAAPSVLLKVVK